MDKLQQIDITLSIALQGLTKDAQKAMDTKEPDISASGHIDFLIEELARLFLTKKQQKQVEAILDLNDRCLFPLTFVSQTEEASSTLPTVQ